MRLWAISWVRAAGLGEAGVMDAMAAGKEEPLSLSTFADVMASVIPMSSHDNRQSPPGSESVSRQMEQVGSEEGERGAEPYDVQRPPEVKRLRS